MHSSPPEIERYMTKEVFKRACEELGDRKSNLEISAYGEPFMHPEFDEFLFIARECCPNAEIVIATNGVLLNDERCRKIVDSGINHLSFSLNAGSTDSYKWLTGKDDYEQICKNLENLVRIRNDKKAYHLKITTHIIGIKELSKEFDAFVEKWSEITDGATVRNYGNWAGLVDENDITPAETQNIPEERYPCAWLWYATKIQPNGDVSKCFIHVTGEKEPIGNIMEQSFESIWKGEKINKMREAHCSNRYDELAYCKDCIVWSLFPKFWQHKKKFGIFKTEEWK